MDVLSVVISVFWVRCWRRLVFIVVVDWLELLFGLCVCVNFDKFFGVVCDGGFFVVVFVVWCLVSSISMFVVRCCSMDSLSISSCNRCYVIVCVIFSFFCFFFWFCVWDWVVFLIFCCCGWLWLIVIFLFCVYLSLFFWGWIGRNCWVFFVCLGCCVWWFCVFIWVFGSCFGVCCCCGNSVGWGCRWFLVGFLWFVWVWWCVVFCGFLFCFFFDRRFDF